MAEYRRLAAYSDVRETLERLVGRRLAILSNGAPDMLDAVVRHAGLDSVLDAVLSVDSLRVYKPHPSVYQLAVDRLGVRNGTFWINRARALPDQLGLGPAGVLSSLSELSAAVG